MSEDNAICLYLKGSTEGAVCMLMGCFVREIGFTGISVCFGEYALCPVYRRYAAASSDPSSGCKDKI